MKLTDLPTRSANVWRTVTHQVDDFWHMAWLGGGE